MKLGSVQEFIDGEDEYEYDVSDSTDFYDTEIGAFIKAFVEVIGIVEDFIDSEVESDRRILAEKLVGMHSVLDHSVIEFIEASCPGFLDYFSITTSDSD